MDGVTLLYQYNPAPRQDIFWIWFSFALLVVIFFYALAEDHQPVIAVAIIVFISLMFGFAYQLMPSDTITYAGAVVNDDVTFNEVVQLYRPVERRGDLWIFEILHNEK